MCSFMACFCFVLFVFVCVYVPLYPLGNHTEVHQNVVDIKHDLVQCHFLLTAVSLTTISLLMNMYHVCQRNGHLWFELLQLVSWLLVYPTLIHPSHKHQNDLPEIPPCHYSAQKPSTGYVPHDSIYMTSSKRQTIGTENRSIFLYDNFLKPSMILHCLDSNLALSQHMEGPTWLPCLPFFFFFFF